MYTKGISIPSTKTVKETEMDSATKDYLNERIKLNQTVNLSIPNFKVSPHDIISETFNLQYLQDRPVGFIVEMNFLILLCL